MQTNENNRGYTARETEYTKHGADIGPEAVRSSFTQELHLSWCTFFNNAYRSTTRGKNNLEQIIMCLSLEMTVYGFFLVFFFFKLFDGHIHMSFLGAIGTPVLDFW